MTKEELLARFTKDVEGMTPSPVTNPMNLQHALMLEAYELGFDLGKRKYTPPEPAPEPMDEALVNLRGRVTHFIKDMGQVHVYIDTYNKRVKLRSRKSKSLDQDLFAEYYGMYKDIDLAKRVVTQIYESGSAR